MPTDMEKFDSIIKDVNIVECQLKTVVEEVPNDQNNSIENLMVKV